MINRKKSAPYRALAEKVIYSALSILRDNAKEMPISDLMAEIEKGVELDDWAKERHEKSGSIRWKSALHLYSIECVKAGYLIKKKGVWYLTPEGEDALKLDPDKLLEKTGIAYNKWRAEHPGKNKKDTTEEDVPDQIYYDEIEQKAIDGLQQYINRKNPYEFQDLVSALLRGMGYYTPFIAPKGRDGGIDIIAYRDPIGTESPRIQVQIKHRESKATVQEVRQLMGLFKKEGDVGIFVSTAGFTTEAHNAARSSPVHVELIDMNRFITLWQDFYDKLKDEDKSLLPLKPIYFLATDQ